MCSFQPRPTSWSGRAPRGWLTGGRPRQCQTQPPTWVFCEREAANKAGRATANRRLLPYIPLAPFAPKAQKLTISRLGRHRLGDPLGRDLSDSDHQLGRAAQLTSARNPAIASISFGTRGPTGELHRGMRACAARRTLTRAQSNGHMGTDAPKR
jgi:hypothetical protein